MKTYVIMGKPTPLSRPRFSHQNKRVFDPQKQSKMIAAISLMSQHDNGPLLVGPLHLEVTFYMPIPERRPSKKDYMIGTMHHIKPDLSNMIKWIEDVSNNIIYRDDALIASITAKKVYDLNPRAEFKITPIVLEM